MECQAALKALDQLKSCFFPPKGGNLPHYFSTKAVSLSGGSQT